MNKSVLSTVFISTLMAIAQPGLAGDVTIANKFTAGTPAVAAQVNDNFSVVESAVNDNYTHITTLEGVNAGTRLTALETNADNPYISGNITLVPSTDTEANVYKGTVSSSRRVKDHLSDMGDTSKVLLKLHPVTFYYKSDRNPKGRALQYGPIGEEVAEVAPPLVARSKTREIETVYYRHLTPMLLNEYQKQQRAISAHWNKTGGFKPHVLPNLSSSPGSLPYSSNRSTV